MTAEISGIVRTASTIWESVIILTTQSIQAAYHYSLSSFEQCNDYGKTYGHLSGGYSDNEKYKKVSVHRPVIA